MKKILLFVFSLFFLHNVFAFSRAGASMDFSSGYVHLENEYEKDGIKFNFPMYKNNWISSADLHIKIDTEAKSIVKAYFDAGLSLTAIPESDFTQAGFLGSITLNKAYLKARLPWFCGQEAKLSLGKMPLNWGFGLYYNAGDLIFGADPNNASLRKDTSFSFTGIEAKKDYESIFTKDKILSLLNSTESSSASFSFNASSLSDFRTSTDWMLSYVMPCTKYCSIEALVVFPFDTLLNSQYGRFGSRLKFFTDFTPLQQMEASYLSTGDFSLQKMSLCFDGTLWLDYNLCSSVSFLKDEGFLEDDFNISFSLTKIFNIQTDIQNHSLQLKAESLVRPLDKGFELFAFASYEITEDFSLSLVYLFYGSGKTEVKDNSHIASLEFSYQAGKNFEFTLQTALNCLKPDKLAAVFAGVSYRY